MWNRPTYTRADYKRAHEICRTDKRFGGPDSVTHDYPGALYEAKRQRESKLPLYRYRGRNT